MTAEDYLVEVLKSQTLFGDCDEMRALNGELLRVQRVLEEGLPDSDPEIVAGGSLAKGTLIRAAYDLDVICYFDNDDTGAGDTLAEIRDSVEEALATEYVVEPKRSALRLTERKEGEALPCLVDVVPGRYVDEKKEDVFLYQEEGEKQRLKTNLHKHVSHIEESGQVDIIKLAKLWKLRADLEIKTFVLELLVIETLKENSAEGLAERLVAFWTALRDDIDDLTIEDPSNPTGNDLEPIFGDAERETLSSAATVALDLVDADEWEVLFGPTDDGDEAVDRAVVAPHALLALGDSSHALPPPWPVRRTRYRAHVECAAFARRGKRFPLRPEGSVVTEGLSLRFHAKTDVPEPYDIKWQVVNTGEHAKDERALRGQRFFDGKTRDGEHRGGPVNWETTLYTGKHWTECFVVKDGELWARSGPFYVSIINRKRRRTPWRPRVKRSRRR